MQIDEVHFSSHVASCALWDNELEESEPAAAAVSELGAITVGSRCLTIAEQERVMAMQRLAKALDRATYLELQGEIVQQLKMSVRNLQHLLRRW